MSLQDITPFQISVPESSIQHLKQKLELTTISDDQEYTDTEEAWSHGPPAEDLRRLIDYWKEGFDWRAIETNLNNQLNMFKTRIDVERFEDVEVHFVHHKSANQSENAIPLLFIHGCELAFLEQSSKLLTPKSSGPGSFLEVSKLLGDLTSVSAGANSEYPTFNIVAPSLPNFGFSSVTTKRGFGLDQYAEVCHKLMLQLGYEQYVTQSGDLGFRIARTIGIRYPTSCKASHINMLRASPPTLLSQPVTWLRYMLTPYSARDKKGFERSKWFVEQGSGTEHPSRLEIKTVDTQELHDWSDDYTWTEDEILTWVSLYWHSTAGPTAAQRIYYEMVNSLGTTINDTEKYVPHVKLGLAHFPKELIVVPTLWCRTLGEVVYEKEHPRGGHFAAYEKPADIVNDLRIMFGRGGGAFAIVDGRDGYAN
ncbi:Epoxide hydrolase protein [Rutstroemia sp. NJR-2017a WRK4]|nr:Epoxide hydrolase protein [Rutstroemia sp. NJR-2017a WRK4]